MYDDKNKINSMYFKQKIKKKDRKLNVYIFLIAICSIFIFLNIIYNKSIETQKKIFVQHKKNNNSLPIPPKEKWKYIKNLGNL